jgi:hypothetical protein
VNFSNQSADNGQQFIDIGQAAGNRRMVGFVHIGVYANVKGV